MSNFEKWDKEFRVQNLYAFNHNENGLLWLKVRAVCRGKQPAGQIVCRLRTRRAARTMDYSRIGYFIIKVLPTDYTDFTN